MSARNSASHTLFGFSPRRLASLLASHAPASAPNTTTTPYQRTLMNPNRSLNMNGSGIGNITLSALKMGGNHSARMADYTILPKPPLTLPSYHVIILKHTIRSVRYSGGCLEIEFAPGAEWPALAGRCRPGNYGSVQRRAGLRVARQLR